MEQIIQDYKAGIPVKNICQNHKIGKKKLYKLLLSQNIVLRPNKTKLTPFPYAKGDVIDGVTILDDNYFFDGERWVIRFICTCGNIDYKRASFIEKKSSFTLCKVCSMKMKYPEHRKRRNDIFDSNGISKTWLSHIKGNLKRGVMQERTLECTITNQDLYEVLKSQNFKCALTGEDLNVILHIKRETNASVDRIDSNKGYTKNNIQWVIKDINLMKNNLDQDLFIELCKKVSKLHDNFEPSLSNDVKVDKKVQRLEGEESSQ